jgi:hypothetical protein
MARSRGLGDVYKRQYRSSTTTPVSTNTWVYNNSAYSDGSTYTIYSMVRMITNNGSYLPTGVVVKNNLGYAPNAATNYNGSNSEYFFTVSGGITGANYTLSNNSTDAQVKSTVPGFTIPPTSTLTTWKPTSGYGIDSGIYVPVFEDFFGAARVPTFDRGAVNP